MDNTTHNHMHHNHTHNFAHRLKLHTAGYAFASALVWAVWTFILGMLSMTMNWGNSMVAVMSSIYVGYAPTVMGSLIGALWGFCFCFVASFFVAWLYNMCACCCKKDPTCCNKDRVV